MRTYIALDAMGSDRAPKPEVEGAILAALSLPTIRRIAACTLRS
jgi:fatty acid/phospholipid biosynthesis enzyme